MMHVLTRLPYAMLVILVWLACAPETGSAAEARADTELLAMVVWGTDGPRPADPNLKELQLEIRQKLQAVFKWKDYYEVNRRVFQVRTRQVQKVRLSPKCEIGVENLGSSNFEVRLYGEGKLIVKKTQVLTPGELLVVAGEDRNDTAWFVVLSLNTK